jgi:hypothetical protein
MVPSCTPSGQCICISSLNPSVKGCNGVANTPC